METKQKRYLKTTTWVGVKQQCGRVEQQFKAVELQCEGLNNNADSRTTYEESNNNVRSPTRTQGIE
jgi:hypothetical protein